MQRSRRLRAHHWLVTVVGAVTRTLRRRVAAVTLAALIGGVLPATAAAYWDWTGYIQPGNHVAEGVPYSPDGIWQYRLNRQNCDARAYLRYRGTNTLSSLSFSGGCSDGDETWGFAQAGYDACWAQNIGSSQVWVNFRCDVAV